MQERGEKKIKQTTELEAYKCKTISFSVDRDIWFMYITCDIALKKVSACISGPCLFRFVVINSTHTLEMDNNFNRHMKDFITRRNRNCQTLIAIMHDRSNFYDFLASIHLFGRTVFQWTRL